MPKGKSGSFNVSTSNSYITGTVYWSETYDVAKNTSNVTVTFKMKRTNNYSGNTTPGQASTFKLWCNGTYYTINIAAKGVTIKPGGVETQIGSHTFTGIAHNTDGSKTMNIAVEGSLVGCGSAGTIKVTIQKKSVTLTKIARLSSLSAENGELGKSQKLTITQQDSSYTHTISYKCGTASDTISTNSSSKFIDFTPPLSLANQNKTGTTVSITFTITTYSGDTSLGSQTKTIICSIPETVKPTVSLTVTDNNGYAETYGYPIKGKSALKIELTEIIGGDSPISFRSITANGETYTDAPCTTSLLKSSGETSVTAKITDQRGRSAESSATVNVLDYESPTITSLYVTRCDSSGTANDQGKYIKVVFSGKITALNNKNTAQWKIQKKKSSDTSYIATTLTALNNNYKPNDYSYIFEADTGSSYDIRIAVTDAFSTVYRATSASTAMTIMHFKENGQGMAVGKISELDDVFDIGWEVRFFNGIKYLEIPSSTNLNSLTKPGFYCCHEGRVTSLVNCPFSDLVSFTLKVESAGTAGQIRQEIIIGHSVNRIKYERFKDSGKWYDWQSFVPRGSFAVVKGKESGDDNQTISTKSEWTSLKLTEKISNNESPTNSIYALSVDSDGTISTNFSGTVALSGAIRLSTGLVAGDLVSLRIIRTLANDTVDDEISGVWDQVCHSANAQTCVVTPTIFVKANAGDKFNLQMRNASGARGTTIATDCQLSLYYI